MNLVPTFGRAYVVTRAGTFEVVPLDDFDKWEADGHDVFTNHLQALLYYDMVNRSRR